MQMQPYLVPEVEVVILQPGRAILELSNYGDPGTPGSGFGGGGGGIIDYPSF